MRSWIVVTLLVAAAGCGQKFKFVSGDGYRDLVHGKTPVWRDMIKYDPADHANTFKNYKHVYAFDGSGFITKGPGGKYTHHRGVFFGFKTQFGDFWHCPDCSQQHVKYLPERQFVGKNVARDAEVTDWVAKDGKAVVRDTREVTTYWISKQHWIMDFDITVEALTDEPIQLGGDAHHAGFHFRAAQEVADVKESTAQYIRPDSATLFKDDIWENENWCHATFAVAGKKYAVTHFDPPTNPRPIQYSTRPYGRLGSFFVTKVEKGKPLHLRYRIVVRDGNTPITKEQLEREYAAWTGPLGSVTTGSQSK